MITFPSDGSSSWAGMADEVLVSPDGRRQVVVRYVGEPPHGDSYHAVEIDGARLPGLAWGGPFAFSPDSRFLACGWMAKPYERRTIVVDLGQRRYCVLPCYMADFVFPWPVLQGAGSADGQRFAFDGREAWTAF